MLDTIAKAVFNRGAILFVGSGVSVGLGLPSWRSLIEQMARETDLDFPLGVGNSANYRTIAEYYRLHHGSIGPLRSWMDHTFSAKADDIQQSKVLAHIVELDFPIIYTTNFDRNLEEAYRLHDKPFAKVANAKDLARIRSDQAQIVKFHGDFDDDRSLVLTETDYFDRLEFESPLDIKLRADALGKPIVFIGYSLSDINIRLLLHKIWRTWRGSGYERERPTSYIFTIEPDPVQEAVLAQWGIATLSEPEVHSERALETFLDQLNEKVRALKDRHTANQS